MDLPPLQAQVSSHHLQSEETLGICPSVSGRQSASLFTVDGRRWSFLASPRGGAVTLKLWGLDLGPGEIGVVHVKLVDRRQNPPVAHGPTQRIVVSRGQPSLLYLPTFAELVEKGVVINDSLAISLSAHVLRSPPKEPSLSKDFGHILESGDGSDVIFRVGDEDFLAHRTVIQARSPALAAEISAALPEAAIVIGGGIEPKAFGAFLKFLYTDDLLGAEEIMGEAYTKEGGCSMTEALFHVAEMFDHEQLKGILEQRMITQLDPSTAARTLAFAEKHGRQQLQANCCRIVVSNGWLHEVIQSNEFRTGNTYPTAAKDALLLEAGLLLKRPRVSVPNPGA
ncbi:unnamed protein product [Urochloa humidicola]